PANELSHPPLHDALPISENAELFPEPTPALTELESSLEAYREAYAEAAFLDKRAVVLKRQQGEELQEVIYRLSHYVDAVANGDPDRKSTRLNSSHVKISY